LHHYGAVFRGKGFFGRKVGFGALAACCLFADFDLDERELGFELGFGFLSLGLSAGLEFGIARGFAGDDGV